MLSNFIAPILVTILGIFIAACSNFLKLDFTIVFKNMTREVVIFDIFLIAFSIAIMVTIMKTRQQTLTNEVSRLKEKLKEQTKLTESYKSELESETQEANEIRKLVSIGRYNVNVNEYLSHVGTNI